MIGLFGLKRVVLFAMLVSFLLAAGAGAEGIGALEASGESLTRELNAKVDRIFKNKDTVGGAVVVYKGDTLVYERYYGYAKRASKTPVTEGTYFRVASVTKFISGIGVMQLVEDGKLSLDGDLSEFLEMPVTNWKYPETKITLRMLMTHTSSLSDDVGFANRENTLSDIFEKNKKRTNFLKKEPGRVYSYSNYGAGMVGAMMEKASEQSVHAYMAEHVFDKLQMDAAYHVSYLAYPELIVNQHDRDGKVERSAASVLKTTYDDTADYQTHYRTTIGDVFITARDMGKLLAMMNGGGEYKGVRILNQASVDEMIAEQNGRNGIDAETPYGLFCQRYDSLVEGKLIYGHQGMSLGMVSNALFDPETGFSIAILTNGANRGQDRRVSLLGRQLFGLLYPLFSK